MTDLTQTACPYCDQPLDHGTGRVIDGLHESCHQQFGRELNEAFPEPEETQPQAA